MQRQCWRWLWIWVSFLIAGCGQGFSPDPSPPPSNEPTQPLLSYTRLPPALTPTIWPVMTATPLITADSGGLFATIAQSLRASSPACYETPLGSLVCLGQVHNASDHPVEQVSVTVLLLASDGMPLASGETYLSRWLLPAGASGPYRVMFDQVPEGFVSAFSVITEGQRAMNSQDRFAELALNQVSGEFVLDQYQVSFSVTNRSGSLVERLAVTMTLLDGQGNVTGFRRVYLDTDQRLQPGEALALSMKVIPQGPNTVGFDVFAEGLLSGAP